MGRETRGASVLIKYLYEHHAVPGEPLVGPHDRIEEKKHKVVVWVAQRAMTQRLPQPPS